jgi:hypothetical protein
VLRPLETPFTEFSFVRADGDRAVYRAGAPDHPASIVKLDLTSGAHRVLKKETDLLDQSELAIANYLSPVKSVEFATTNGNSASAPALMQPLLRWQFISDGDEGSRQARRKSRVPCFATGGKEHAVQSRRCHSVESRRRSDDCIQTFQISGRA